jgi:hypothetical protein
MVLNEVLLAYESFDIESINLDMLEQIILLLIILSSGISAIFFLFWILFKKDAPSIEELNNKSE